MRAWCSEKFTEPLSNLCELQVQEIRYSPERRHFPNLFVGQHSIPASHSAVANPVLNRHEHLWRR
jgi:hypothetical protein